MKKRGISMLMAASLLAASLCACAGSGGEPETVQPSFSSTPETDSQSAETSEEETTLPETLPQETGEDDSGKIEVAARDAEVTPCAAPYTIEPDLSNVDNAWQFYLEIEEMRDKLAQNGFVITGDAGCEFYEIYETNRYSQIASFVTVDSLMHTYHLYFSYLMKNLEKDYLADRLAQISGLLLADSRALYTQLKGSPWEDAALRTLTFFNVGARLLDAQAETDEAAEAAVAHELDRIMAAEGIETCSVTGEYEDYTQYAPRGYYEGDELLERYFRAMMWYGRIHFAQKSEEATRCALLITWLLSEDAQAHDLWKSVYEVTSFFAGASDDPGVDEYLPILQETYGETIAVDDLVYNTDAFPLFCEKIAALPAPAINSQPIREGEDNVILGFRFMGQRFSIDAAILQRLIYQNVEENPAGEKRLLPDVLDIPAALGSDAALQILEDLGATDYAGYPEQMTLLRTALSQENQSLWSASLSSGWLDTLRPLLTPKGEGYPLFMQNDEWTKKDLECFAGSFAELKHDTVLYAKQAMAEMGGPGDERIPDDRGYVEPEPLVYAKFAELSERTALGLSQYGLLSDADRENLDRLTQIADTLLAISKKELQNELPTDEEFDFIRSYGGNIEHFWLESVKELNGGDYIDTRESPAAIITDIATDPNGSVLETGTGNPSSILTVVFVDGKVKLARGSVYTFYQFPWPIDDRLTDTKWRRMLGIQQGEDGNFGRDDSIRQPEWTDGYRYRYEWES